MGRSHARVYTVIWDDPDFLALSGLAQRCYFMLLSQPNLGHAGVLPTTVRRWTLLCGDEDEGRLRAALAELADRRFIVTDETTEELLVRSLIRNDGVWKQPKVLAVAIGEAASIRSALLRATVAEELARIDCAELPDKTRPEVEALLKDLPYRLVNAHLEGGTHPPQHPPADPPPHLPGMGDAEGVRVRAQAAPSPSPTPAVQPPAVADEPRPGAAPSATPETANQRANRLARTYTDQVKVSNFPAVAKIVRKAVDADLPDVAIIAGLKKVIADNQSLTTETLRVAIYGKPRGQSTAEERARQALDSTAEAVAIINAMEES